MTGATLYAEAKKLIPGGSNLFSKRGELYAEGWPQYYRSAAGVRVTDLDGRTYLDFSGASVGACLLGYGDKEVDAAVCRGITSGSTSALLCPEEVELAKILTTIHPWAQMCRFTRSGGEAISVAIRIAQAYTGRKGVGWRRESYHGWHINDPRTGEPFVDNYLRNWNAAAIVVEPARLKEPDIAELQRIRDYTREKGIVLIFDEISTGFRFNLGGLHLALGITPDIVVYSKAIANGYPLGAVVGTREVMEAAERTFISSTTWSERIGPTAGVATVQKLWANDVHDHIQYIGELVRDTYKWEAFHAGLDLEVEGLGPILHVKTDPKTQTLITQLMLKRGFLVTKDFYSMYAHRVEDVEDFKWALRESMQEIKNGAEVKGSLAESGIRR